MWIVVLIQTLGAIALELIKRQWGHRRKPKHIVSKENMKAEIKCLREKLERLEQL